jgi:hypothetical protein
MRKLTLMLLLLGLMLSGETGCATKPATVYLSGDSQPHPVSKGQASPIDGYVLSPIALDDLLRTAEDCQKKQ